MKILEKIKSPIKKEMDLFEEKFSSSMISDVPLLNRITHYVVKRKGKQMRPMFVFLTAKMMSNNGCVNEKVFRAASIIELIHTATLIHDDVVDSSDLMVTDADAQVILQAFGQKKQAEAAAKQQEEQAAMYGNVQEDGLKFLAENKTKEGVQVTASGLQYVVLKEGTGAQPTAESNVEVHYHGTTPDGTVFDSSVDRGKTISFGLNQVIKGWTEGVQLMKVGAKYRFFIPQELAYGSQPQRDPNSPIKPYMPLVFEVELFKIN